MSSENRPPPRRGALIAIEGLDRAGKSTQCNMLLERMNNEGIPVILQKFPDRITPIGLMINSYLQNVENMDDRAIHLLFSANRWEACEKLKRLIASGTTVIMDRYVYSGIVFSAAKEANLPIEWCRAPDVGLPRPDVVVFLSISQEDAAKRAGFGDERYENQKMQDRVRTLFGELCKDPRDEGDWWVVDAAKSLEEVHAAVWEGVQNGRKRAGESELRQFS